MIVSLSTHRAQRLTRLSGLVLSGTFGATLGRWGLLLATMPLMNAARVAKWRASRPERVLIPDSALPTSLRAEVGARLGA